MTTPSPEGNGFSEHVRPIGPRYALKAQSEPIRNNVRRCFSLMCGSSFTCGPTPQNLLHEVVKEPCQTRIEALPLLCGCLSDRIEQDYTRYLFDKQALKGGMRLPLSP